jgi:FlaA1/EpsC-like NDP-sugar epimerase
MIPLRNRHFFALDLMLIPAAAVLAFVLRLDIVRLQNQGWAILLFTALALAIKLPVFYWLGLYRRYWRYASVDELLQVAVAASVGEILLAALLFGVGLPLSGISAFPRSIPFIDGLLTLVVIGGPRFSIRFAERWHYRIRRRERPDAERKVLVVGAGNAGTMIVQEMRSNPQLGLEPVAFLDDDRSKHGAQIRGLPVLGGRERIPELAEDYGVAEVIIAMPTAPGSAVREILAICKGAGVAARTIPGLYDILSGQVSVSQIRDVDIEDLLRREPVATDITAVEAMLRGCRVLVTGAGGSIGGELCRQIARCAPESLVLVGHGENSIFDIANELRRLWPDLDIAQVIADVRDRQRLHHVFGVHEPQTVFHAAAHKHVPLMEANVAEAVTNNIVGTSNLLALALSHSVDRFVFISTDKAVNPSSVMGATKRIAELLVQASALKSGQPYVAVRFGNVLGSRGSVVPLFRDQIKSGGPVTVTHPQVSRYFMTVPEAVQLVLQASTLGKGGEVFALDMGEQIRIVDLATDLIELSGLKPGQDVEIVFTGLRPGEKLHEEVSLPGEEYVPTGHEKIFSWSNGLYSAERYQELERIVGELVTLAAQGDEARIRAKLQEMVPEFAPTGVISQHGQMQEAQALAARRDDNES